MTGGKKKQYIIINYGKNYRDDTASLFGLLFTTSLLYMVYEFIMGFYSFMPT